VADRIRYRPDNPRCDTISSVSVDCSFTDLNFARMWEISSPSERSASPTWHRAHPSASNNKVSAEANSMMWRESRTRKAVIGTNPRSAKILASSDKRGRNKIRPRSATTYHPSRIRRFAQRDGARLNYGHERCCSLPLCAEWRSVGSQTANPYNKRIITRESNKNTPGCIRGKATG
jgi:hypothetical protein